jgi:hypothetical protein
MGEDEKAEEEKGNTAGVEPATADWECAVLAVAPCSPLRAFYYFPTISDCGSGGRVRLGGSLATFSLFHSTSPTLAKVSTPAMPSL